MGTSRNLWLRFVAGKFHFVAAVVGMVLFGSTGSDAASYELVIQEDSWTKRVFLQPGSTLTEDQAATLAIVADPELGAALSIGPWISGRWSLRYQYDQLFAFNTGTIRGMFRTEGLVPQDAEISVSWYQAGTRIEKATLPLGTSSTWASFEIPLRAPYPGADSIGLAFGLSTKTGGTAFFSDLSFEDSFAPLGAATLPPLTRAQPPADLSPAPSIRLIDDNGTWWFVKPDGTPFYGRGTHFPNWTKGDLVAADDNASLLKSGGFNVVGGWSSIYRWLEANEDVLIPRGDAPLYVFQTKNLSDGSTSYSYLQNAQGEYSGGTGHWFADPFDPGFASYLNDYYYDKFSLVENTPWFVGWSPDNEASHKDLQRYVYSTHAAQAFKAFLSDRHDGDIAALNAAWETSFASFDDILAQKPDPEVTAGPMYDDFAAFAVEIVREYVRVMKQAILDNDPQHLIFTPQLNVGGYPEWERYLEIYAEAFDAVMINMYPGNADYGLSADLIEILNDIHARTGKPIVVTEWSVPALDSGLYDDPAMIDFSWKRTVETQTERAYQARAATADWYNLPFVVGTHWFKWNDYDDASRRANRGLADVDDNIYVELWDALTAGHAALVAHEQTAGPANSAPITVDDGATVAENGAVTINVLANDSDPDGDVLSVAAVASAANGTATSDGATVTYTPDTGFSGSDSFTYTLSDGRGGSAVGNVAVTVTPNASPPAAPSGVAAQPGSADGTADIVWQDNSANETGFEVQRETKHKKRDSWNGIAVVALTAANQTAATDASGTGTFRYRVRAVNGAGVSGWSTWAEVTIASSGGGGSGGGGGGGGTKPCKGKKCET